MTAALGHPLHFYVQILAVGTVAAAVFFRNDRRVIRLVVAASLLAALAYFVSDAVLAPLTTPGYDFASYYVAARDLVAGGDPYAHFEQLLRGCGPYPALLQAYHIPRIPPVTYPPPFYLVLAPLTALTYIAAWKVWIFVNVGLLAVTVFFAAKAAGLTDPWAIMAATALTIIAHPVISNAAEGQANLAVALLLAAGAWATTGRGRLWAPVFFAAAALVKLYPFAFLLYYLLAKKVKETVIFAGVVAAVVGAVSAGWGPGLWTSYLTKAIPPYLLAPRGFDMNVSWEGFLVRTLAGVGASGVLLALAPKLTAAAILLAGTLWAVSRKHDPPGGELIIVVLALFVNGWTLHHYLVALIPTFVYAAARVGALKRWEGLFLAAAYFLIIWRFDYWRYDSFPSNLLQSTKTLGMLILLGLLFKLTGDKRPQLNIS